MIASEWKHSGFVSWKFIVILWLDLILVKEYSLWIPKNVELSLKLEIEYKLCFLV